MTHAVFSASVAQLAARGSHNPKVVGSTPTGGRFLFKLLVRNSALVAQLAALRSYEPMVRGSSPRRSNFVAGTTIYLARTVRYHAAINFH